MKSSILRFSREREQQGMNHFNLRAASKLRFVISHVKIPSCKTKKERKSSTNKKGKKWKSKIQQPSSLTIRASCFILELRAKVLSATDPALNRRNNLLLFGATTGWYPVHSSLQLIVTPVKLMNLVLVTLASFVELF